MTMFALITITSGILTLFGTVISAPANISQDLQTNVTTRDGNQTEMVNSFELTISDNSTNMTSNIDTFEILDLSLSNSSMENVSLNFVDKETVLSYNETNEYNNVSVNADGNVSKPAQNLGTGEDQADSVIDNSSTTTAATEDTEQHQNVTAAIETTTKTTTRTTTQATTKPVIEASTTPIIKATTTPVIAATTTQQGTTGLVSTTASTTTTMLNPAAGNVPTDRTGVPCMVNFKVNPDNIRQYKVATYGGEYTENWLNCPTNLVWNNETCRCDWPEVNIDPNCKCCTKGLMAHDRDNRMYKQYTNGVWIEKSCIGATSIMIWDNDNCLCKWDLKEQKAKLLETWKPVPVPEYNMQCVKLLDMSLDKDYSNDVRIGRYVQLVSAARRIRFKTVKGSVNGAMAIRRSPLQLSSFQNNGLTKNMYLRFNFKTHPKHKSSYNKMTILSNGCSGDKPSLAISFIPANETLEIILRTNSKNLHLFLKANKDRFWWYKTEMYLYDKHFVVNVNNKQVYKSNGLRGDILKTSCPLTIAGSQDNPRLGWDGYLDEMMMVKQCPYPQLYPEKLMKTR